MDEPALDRLIDRIVGVLAQAENAPDELTRDLLRERVPALIDEAGDRETVQRLYEALLRVKTVVISKEDLEAFECMRVMERPNWKLSYSLDGKGTFPQVRWGKTPESERMYMNGLSKTFERLAREAAGVRHSGGRFFISEKGVFYKVNGPGAREHQVIRFEFA